MPYLTRQTPWASCGCVILALVTVPVIIFHRLLQAFAHTHTTVFAHSMHISALTAAARACACSLLVQHCAPAVSCCVWPKGAIPFDCRICFLMHPLV